MPAVPESKISKRTRDLFEKGMAAMERNNLDYAMDMFRSAVEAEPGFLKARKLLRAASLKKFKESKGGQVTHIVSTATSLPLLIKGFIALQTGKPGKALSIAEDLMLKDPLNMLFIKLLCRAAEADDMSEVAIQTLEIAREFYPDNADIMMWLGNIYTKTEQLKEAQEIFSVLAEMRPNDGDVKRLLKNAMASGTLSRGWNQAAQEGGSYDLVKDAQETAALEHQGKIVRGERGTELLINETLLKIEKEPANLNFRRSLANLYVEAKDFDKAVETLVESKKFAGEDPQTDRAIADIKIKKYDYDINRLRAEGDTTAADALASEKDKFMFENIRNLVERYPNDLQLRYQYGVQLFEHGMYNEAIEEFQQAQKNVQRRAHSLYYIGMCFREKEQFDMAREQLENALSEAPEMKDLRKAILYELGLVSEKMGDADTAINKYYKEIYKADIKYRDVAEKIEKAYRK